METNIKGGTYLKKLGDNSAEMVLVNVWSDGEIQLSVIEPYLSMDDLAERYERNGSLGQDALADYNSFSYPFGSKEFEELYSYVENGEYVDEGTFVSRYLS